MGRLVFLPSSFDNDLVFGALMGTHIADLKGAEVVTYEPDHTILGRNIDINPPSFRWRPEPDLRIRTGYESSAPNSQSCERSMRRWCGD